MKSVLIIGFSVFISAISFSQSNIYNCETDFIKKYTIQYTRYKKKYIRKTKKIVSQYFKETKNEKIEINSLEIIVIPVINFKYKIKNKKSDHDFKNLFCFLNSRRLFYEDIKIFYKKKFIGYMLPGRSLKNPKLVFCNYININTAYLDFLEEKANNIKFYVNNFSQIIFYVENNRIYMYDYRENRSFKDINILKKNFNCKMEYNKIRLVTAK